VLPHSDACALLALTAGHDRRLEHGGAPPGVLGPERADDPPDVGTRHGCAGHYAVGDAAVVERQARERDRAAVRGDHADARRRDVRLQQTKELGNGTRSNSNSESWEACVRQP
jgi:hypothetical protein